MTLQQKRKYRGAVALLLAIICVLCGNVSALSDREACGWYVCRNTQHRQPTLDAAQAAAEKHHAYYVDRAHGDTCEEKVLYLTFDAGYENGNVAKILDVLKEEQVPGAFFILKNLLTREQALVERMIAEGHTVGNHTLHHKDMTRLSDDDVRAELEGLATLYKETTGKEIKKYYRPPEGKYTLHHLDTVAELGYETIFWSFAYADWDNNKQPDPESAKKKILDNTHNGAVILLHPTSATNAAILSDLIHEWRKMGYHFGTLDSLCQKEEVE